MSSVKPVVLDLALQGGGAHGAFTWGVLDRLLDEPTVSIGRISGTSAGALNGAALATGFARDGRAGGQALLAHLWQTIAQVGWPLTFMLAPLRKPGLGIWDDMLPLVAPMQANPTGLGPLRAIVSAVVDLDALRSHAAPQLYVNAVSALSGQSRVFGPSDMSIEAIMASACAPMTFEGVPIEDDVYWDGSYASNPALAPLYEKKPNGDVLLVELTPLRRGELPLTAKNILNRINEIASIRGLAADMGAINDRNRRSSGPSTRVHLISLAEHATPQQIEPSIKRTVGWELFRFLRDIGRTACDEWLACHRAQLGISSTVDFESRYVTPYRDA